MTHEEILKGAIEKAVKNGFVPPIGHITITYNVTPQYGPHIRKHSKLGLEWSEIIFSHDFAKAFWGDEQVDGNGFRTICGPLEAWQYHLQQMVLEDDPIAYLQRFL